METYFENEELRNFVMGKLQKTIIKMLSNNSLNEIRTMLNDDEVSDSQLVSDIQHILSLYDSDRDTLDELIPDEILEQHNL